MQGPLAAFALAERERRAKPVAMEAEFLAAASREPLLRTSLSKTPSRSGKFLPTA